MRKMKLIHGNQLELGMVVRKLLNMRDKKSDYSAADIVSDEDECHTECDTQEFSDWTRDMDIKTDHQPHGDLNEVLPRLRRQNSETFRGQYITAKELRVCACTWNVGGELPPDDLDIQGWLDVSEPADIYVIGFQEIIPLNAGNIFGSEDTRPIPKWESIIGETLNKIQPAKDKYKCYSNPPSPTRFKQSDDFPYIEDEILLETDSHEEEEIYSLNEESDFKEESDGASTAQKMFPTAGAYNNFNMPLEQQLRSSEKLGKLNRLQTEDSEGNPIANVPAIKNRFKKTLIRTQMVGLNWAEPPLDLIQCILERPDPVRFSKSFKASKSLRTFNSVKSSMNDDTRLQSEAASISKVDLEFPVKRKKRSHYVRIVSKNMVGLFLTIWARKSLRRHIQNVNVSTVGVGAMGYIGNKGSISVSMSVYQTLFCFICTHLSSGETEAEAIKRNANVNTIHRRSQFNSFSSIGLPKSIHDHERIIWLGDLNYRIDLPYEETRNLISKSGWAELVEYDQLIQEFRKGRAFDGWSEGTLNFPPTYKYELNSDKYYGEDPKLGRRTPAWCDRIISLGKGMKLISYRRTEHTISDHRPVAASYMIEVEVFCPMRLKKALSYTDAQLEHEVLAANIGCGGAMAWLD